MKRMRKLMCMVLAVAMVITILPTSLAAEDTELTKMVKLAKGRLEIPEEYTEFESSKSVRGTRNIYSLHWETADEEEPEKIDVTIRDDGLILYYYNSDSTGRNSGFAEIEKEEAEKRAEEWINRVYPGYFEKLDKPNITEPSFFNNEYSIMYSRVINGIVYAYDSIYVTVNKFDGKIRYASVNWETTNNIAKTENVIGEEKAGEILGKEMGFELSYRKLQKENRAMLVYSPKETGIELDATTGERFERIYTDESDDVLMEEEGVSEAPMTGGSASGGATTEKNEANVTLTEKELEGIKEIESLLSKSDISSIIKRMAGTDVASFNVKGVRYIKRGEEGKEKYIAYVMLYHENGSGDVTLDAETGELLSLYSYRWDVNNKGKNPKSREAMKITCENFIGNWAKDIKDELMEKSYSGTGGYFTFVQDVDGIPYNENSVYMNVDRYTGKITSYNKYWNDEIEFEGKDGIITAEDAAKTYVAAAEVVLDYERNNISRASGEAQKLDLIYRLMKNFNFVSAKEGKLLDWNLEPYDKEEEEEYAMPSDLSGHWLEKVAEKLAKNGMVVYNKENFRPDDAITYKEAKEIAEIFNMSSYYRYYYNSSEVEFDNEPKDEDKLTREKAVLYIVNMKGYEKAAKIQGIYKTGFADEADITPGMTGFVAIAKGLGIVSGVNGKFEPQRNITRAEFVMMLYNSLGK